MAKSYKKNPQIDSYYDQILIGSGIGCLTAAALLSKQGFKTLVLEQHYTAGGFTHVFKRKGFEWDVGIHYIGEAHRKGTAMERLFSYISDGRLEWAEMDAVYDRIFIGERSYDFVSGVENYKKSLKADFPGEESAIDQYVDHVFAATRSSLSFYMQKALPSWLGNLLYKRMTKKFFRYSDQTTYDLLSSLTDNQELIKVLSGQYGDYGLPPKASSFAMHASVSKHYFKGGCFPVGGSSKIYESILPLIEKTGGSVLINAKVNRIQIKNGKATGVIMEDGREIKAGKIISGAGVINTFDKLIDPKISASLGLQKMLKKVKPSVSHACLYLGLEGSPEELGLPKTNYWIYPSEGSHDEIVENYIKDPKSELPVVYISFPASKDPDFAQRYPGKSTIDLITLVPYEAVSQWSDTRWMKRGDDYLSFKKDLEDRLLKTLFKHFPQLEDKIIHQELSTPLSTKHFTDYQKGEIYGLDHSPERFRQKFLQPRTPVKNLFLTGQDVVTAGVGGALFAGLLTASAITGKNLMKVILKRT